MSNFIEFSELTNEQKENILHNIHVLCFTPKCGCCSEFIQDYDIDVHSWNHSHYNSETIQSIDIIDISLPDCDDNKPFTAGNEDYSEDTFCADCVSTCDSHKSSNIDCDEWVFNHGKVPLKAKYSLDCYDAGYNMDSYEIRGTIGSDTDTLCMACYEQIPNCGYCGEYFDEHSDITAHDDTVYTSGIDKIDDIQSEYFFEFSLENCKDSRVIEFTAALEKAYEEYTLEQLHENNDYQNCCHCIDTIKNDVKYTQDFIAAYITGLTTHINYFVLALIGIGGNSFKLDISTYRANQVFIDGTKPESLHTVNIIENIAA